MGRLALSGKPWIIIIAGVALIGAVFAQGEAQASSDIFFLDLGIVIEPVNGDKTFSRVVKPSSEEVKFRIKKVESGSVYMASSKEMLSALERINRRIEKLENSFRAEMSGLKKENLNLRASLTELKIKTTQAREEIQETKVVEIPIKEDLLPVAEKTPPSPEDPPQKNDAVVLEKSSPVFDQALYMSGVFAYQREDYEGALNKFSRLNLESAPQKTVENVYYWMADAHRQLGDYTASLTLLEKIEEEGQQRMDDALIQKGLLYRKMGMESQALTAFSDVVNKYPHSEYIRLAQMELKKAEVMP